MSLRSCSAAGLLCVAVCGLARAQESQPAGGDAAQTAEPLASRQEAIVLRYQRFEATLLQLAEYMRRTDPDRAELLVRALGRSKESRIPDQLRQIADLLSKDQLGDAIDNQDQVITQMHQVLLLLQSEDRQDEIEKEKQRIKALIKDVSGLIAKENEVRSATERRAPADQIQGQQQRVADDTQRLIDKINSQDQERAAQQSGGKRSPSKPGGESSDKPDHSSKPQPGEPQGSRDEQPAPADKKDSSTPQNGSQEKPPGSAPQQPAGERPSDPSGKSPPTQSQSPSESGKPSPPSQPSPGQSQPSLPQESGEESPQRPSSQPQTPGRQELERAKQEMEQAIRDLEQKQLQKASDSQDQALAELHKAKERLEEILRQLREEEKELMLAALEARFRDMLARQLNVYNGTVGLATVPEAQRADKHRSRAVELARSQDEIALLAYKTLTLLKEEGSSVAFPEAVLQVRDDMVTSARRLERVEVGEITQGIQRDIIESLEEILDSLQKELEKSRDKQQQQQQQQQPQDQALVDVLAELKMLRSLQYRVNRRTKQLGRVVEGEQARDPDVVRQLQQLAGRQSKIQQTAADLAAGRNK